MAGDKPEEEKETCEHCGRDDCGWFDTHNDHSCPGFVKWAIAAQIEELGREEGVNLLMEVALQEQGHYIASIGVECKHTSWESERSHTLTIDDDNDDCKEIGIHMKCTKCGQHGYAMWRMTDTDLPYTGKLD